MSARVSAAPQRLQAYTTTTLPEVARTEAVVDAYRRALARLRAAGTGEAPVVEDLGPELAALLDRLRRLDRAPAVYAAALQALDRQHARLALALYAIAGGPRTQPAPPSPLEHIERRARRLKQTLGAFGDLGSLLEGTAQLLPEGPDPDMILRQWEPIVLASDEVGGRRWLRSVVVIEDYQRGVSRVAVDVDARALDGAVRWLDRAGAAADVVHGGLAGYEQWQEDAERPEVTATERVVRAGTDAAVRGGAQALVGAAGAAAVAAVPVTGGASLVVAGAAVAGTSVAGDAVDRRLESALDAGYEHAADDVARAIDGAGRGVRDGAGAAWEWSGDRVGAAAGVAGDAADWLGERATRW